MTPLVKAQMSVLVKKIEIGSSTFSAFAEIFTLLTDKFGNYFYCLEGDYNGLFSQNRINEWQNSFLKEANLPDFDNYNLLSGELIYLPIPSAFTTTDDRNLGLSDHCIIPLLINLSTNPYQGSNGFPHFCLKGDKDGSGTNCTVSISTDPIIFKTEGVKMPIPKGPAADLEVKTYTDKVEKFRRKNLFYTPVITPSRAVIYVISTDEDKLSDYVKDKNATDRYSIPLNGFIIPIDDWDCFIHFIPEAA